MRGNEDREVRNDPDKEKKIATRINAGLAASTKQISLATPSIQNATWHTNRKMAKAGRSIRLCTLARTKVMQRCNDVTSVKNLESGLMGPYWKASEDRLSFSLQALRCDPSQCGKHADLQHIWLLLTLGRYVHSALSSCCKPMRLGSAEVERALYVVYPMENRHGHEGCRRACDTKRSDGVPEEIKEMSLAAADSPSVAFEDVHPP